MKRKYLFPCLLALSALSAGARSGNATLSLSTRPAAARTDNVCSETEHTKTVRADYLNRLTELNALGTADSLQNLRVTNETRHALEFLYAYMPWPDVADYPLSFHLRQTELALRARQEMPWGKLIPQREWLHFVLPVRVNNEHLDDFRNVCYEELKERVKGMTMREAVLEINHWCHEHVTYKPSDARTSSPLASMRTATGRCGEESTFTVAALRAAGIPARQVYTPRWAHTDDNHAWVEAWVDGKWYFLGACEPEPVLNLGWFNQPASRGMLMHTKVFGRYDGPEDVMDANACYTEINVTDNYARTARTTVRVTDETGRVIPGADVEFKLYNYAELYTVQRTKADSDGRCSILTGLGDLVVWASHNGHYGFASFTAGKNPEVTVSLTHRPGERFTRELTLVPPAGHNRLPEVTAEQATANVRRLAYEDSLRTAYVQTFADSAQTAALCRETGLDYEAVRPWVVKSCGNHRALFTLLRTYPSTATLRFLATLSDKDLRDFDLSVLTDHLRLLPPFAADRKGSEQTDGLTAAQEEFLYKYVYSPRIANETLSPWRSYFLAQRPMAATAQQGGGEIAEWIIRHIRDNRERNPLGYTLSPERAFESRLADGYNRGLLFVALCRSFGIPARIDEVTGNVQYAVVKPGAALPTASEAVWTTVLIAQQPADVPSSVSAQPATLQLRYEPRPFMENPAYFTHFTLSRLRNGSPSLQNYPETARWQSLFARPLAVEPGDYLLTSGTRMADGMVLARLEAIPILPGSQTAGQLVMREDKEGIQVLGSFNAENRYTDASTGKLKSILSTTGRGYYVAGLIRANHEPSNHILHDLEKMRAELEAWGRPILLVFPDADEYARFLKTRSEFTNLPSTVHFGIDTQGSIRRELLDGPLAHSAGLPFMIIADTFNRVVFCTQGYTIGIGEGIQNVVRKL